MNVGAIKRLATTVLMVRYYVCGHNESKEIPSWSSNLENPISATAGLQKFIVQTSLSSFYHVLFYHSKPITLFLVQLGHVPTKEWYVI